MKKLFVLCLFFNTLLLYSQKTLIHKNPENNFKSALELFNKEHYSAAYEMFSKVADLSKDYNSQIYASCQFYMAVCSYYLEQNQTEFKLQKFIDDYPDNNFFNLAKLYLGKHYFRDKKYKKSLEQFQSIDEKLLPESEKYEYYFKYGYSLFIDNQPDNALVQFKKVKDTESEYAHHATYYFAHISYANKNYTIAYENFKKLEKDDTYKDIVPYYITQILYYQQKYSELIQYAEPLMDKADVMMPSEIARLIGEAYFNLKKYKEALKYFEKYKEKTKTKLSDFDNYKIGYLYYHTENYLAAIHYFQEATKGRDSIAQYSHYHLGFCYLKTNEKVQARTAFQAAYKIKANPTITEDAMFQFAKISYELSMDPYNEAMAALIDYIENYPDNPRADEAYEYLTNLYYMTKNYKEALATLEKVKRTNDKLNAVYQKVAYLRALQLFNDKQFEEAIATFDKALRYFNNLEIRALSFFWKAEAYYRLRKTQKALDEYLNFLNSPRAFESGFFYLAYYNIAYCYFNQKNYEKAIVYFKTFLDKSKDENKAIISDACIRLGDSYFATKRYNDAITAYEKAIKLEDEYADYALLQKAYARGILMDYNGKINDLTILLSKYPQTKLMPDVLYELGNTYLTINNNEKAIEYYSQILNNYPTSSYRVKALLRIGLIHYNQGNNELALNYLKKVVEDYKGTNESKEALIVMKNIYTEINQVDNYVSYVQNVSGASITQQEQDTLAYVAAENNFMKNDCQSAISGFEKYISTFPQGIFIVNANFYTAECYFKMEQFSKALKHYEFVISQNWNKFSETSLLKAARIYFSMKNWEKAAEYFARLDENAELSENVLNARLGAMRSYFNALQYRNAVKYGQKLLQLPKLNDDILFEARSIMGQSYFNLNDYANAKSFFNLQKNLNSEYGAQAYYHLAAIEYKNKNFDEAEKLIFDLVNNLPSYEYWIAKSFIILADVYVAKNNLYQAKQTLQSIIENYEGEDVVNEAKEKMNQYFSEKEVDEQ